jgi:hypothetical protein
MLRQAQHDIVAVTLSPSADGSKGNHVPNHSGVIPYFNSIGDSTCRGRGTTTHE